MEESQMVKGKAMEESSGSREMTVATGMAVGNMEKPVDCGFEKSYSN